MTTTPIRKKEEIDLLKEYFLASQEYRDYALFVIGINTALRISDLLLLKWIDVWDFEKNSFKSHVYITEQKTNKHTCFTLNESCRSALKILFKNRKPLFADEYIFYSGKNRHKPISRNRAYNIIKKAAISNSIDGNISCHSLRKTFGYHAWKAGTPPAVLMNIYNHSNMEITKRYLSIIQDDKDEVFNKINL